MTGPGESELACPHDFRIIRYDAAFASLWCDRCHGAALLRACPGCGGWHRVRPGPGSAPETLLGPGYPPGTWLLP